METSIIITLTGPSGSGKSTLTNNLLDLFGKKCRFIPSITTRKQRTSEHDAKYREYLHISHERFKKFESLGRFLWTEKVAEEWYGTLATSILDHRGIGIMILTPKGGVLKLHNALEEHRTVLEERKKKILVFSYYIYEPDRDLLVERMVDRGEDIKKINQRLAAADKWDEEAQEISRCFKEMLYIHEGLNIKKAHEILREISELLRHAV